MPSCVVKSCKNNSTSQKKNQGITFHRFPNDNEPWKRDWIEILRSCRGEKDWNPSTTSVICSAHFDLTDFYTTKMGRRRVVTFANPKKLLYETSNIKEEVDKPNTSNSLQGSSPTIKPVNHTEQILVEISNVKEEPDEPNTSSPLRDNSLTIGPVTTNNTQVVVEITNIKQEPLDEPDTPSSLQGSLSTARPGTTFVQQVSFEPPTPPVIKAEDADTESSQSSCDIISSDEDGLEESVGLSKPSTTSEHLPRRQIIKEADINFVHSSSFSPSVFPNTSLILTQNALSPVAASLDPLEWTPRERNLREALLRTKIVNCNQKKKIKMLNQKIRRLQKRNNTLKTQLKSLKNNNHVDRSESE